MCLVGAADGRISVEHVRVRRSMGGDAGWGRKEGRKRERESALVRASQIS